MWAPPPSLSLSLSLPQLLSGPLTCSSDCWLTLHGLSHIDLVLLCSDFSKLHGYVQEAVSSSLPGELYLFGPQNLQDPFVLLSCTDEETPSSVFSVPHW